MTASELVALGLPEGVAVVLSHKLTREEADRLAQSYRSMVEAAEAAVETEIAYIEWMHEREMMRNQNCKT